MNEEINKLSLEETFDKIEELMEQMQDENIPLEKSFGLYKEGMDLLSHCKEVIDTVEKKVVQLSATEEAED